MKEVWRCSYTTRSNKETSVQWLETPEERDAYLAVAPTAGNPVAVRYVQADQPAVTETGPCPECERRGELYRKVDALAERVLGEPQNVAALAEQAPRGAPPIRTLGPRPRVVIANADGEPDDKPSCVKCEACLFPHETICPHCRAAQPTCEVV